MAGALAALLCLASAPAAIPPDISKLPAAAPGSPDFAREIQPIFNGHCLSCHGPEKQKGGLRLDAKAAALKGGDSGPAILPGKPTESRLLHLVAGLEPDKVMPAKGERLTSAQIGLLRAWIEQGANWPDTASTAARSDHWSLQPLPASVVSEAVISNQLRSAMNKTPRLRSLTADSLFTRSPIDSAVTARLATNGLALAPEADRATLIRRLTFDLTGLPPTPQDVDDFLKDSSREAREKVVERLLASPRYGERWGRHWLDVARYTESQGFEYDRLRDNAWHYRDYVIRSFNTDKPYDQFMREQIAGDALEPATTDGIVGASLLVCGAWDEAGNGQANATQRAITREEELEDLISVVGQTFLGLTINCARCHSHKFDPIPQEEYYRIKSVFEGVKHGERSIATRAETEAREAQIASLKHQIGKAEATLSNLEAVGWKAAVSRKAGNTNSAQPLPMALTRWAFDGGPTGTLGGELKGEATITNGVLRLARDGDYFQAATLPREVSEKTLEAWVSLADLNQGGGAAISIETEDGRSFDGIVFGERQPRKWTAGSGGFQRTKDLEAPEENAPAGGFVHMVAVYHADNSIKLYRNGEPYGQPYTPGSPLQTFKAGESHVVLGLRHKGGGKPYLRGDIKVAALYDRALSESEVKSAFRSTGLGVSREESLAALGDEHKHQHAAALRQLEQLRKTLKEVPRPAVSYAGTRIQPAPTHRLRRGDVKSPVEVVTPGALSALADLNHDFGLPADAPEAQRRLKFAAWLCDARNPLPARVMANRVWALHFGQGLVATPNDFGAAGARPSHPELLDWLAMKLIESGWSVKSLHRLIVNSAAYQQSSRFDARAAAVDADNQLLWRFSPRRLEAETLRDAMLAASGELNLEEGGPSFRPFDVLKFPISAYQPADKPGPEFNRRTVYRMNVNSGKEPLLDAFDCPDPSVKTPRRGVTTTPLQALALMNNSFVQRQAEKLADRALAKAKGNPEKSVQAAYRLALGRTATPEEIKRAAGVIRNRGLAHVCWALLNSTEFVYVQ